MRQSRFQIMSIVITGNPGVGKHTITAEIVKSLELDIIDINKIAKDSGLLEKDENTNDVDTEKLGKILEKKISEKNLVVGHLAPYILDKNQVKIIIILRRNPYELISVYNDRKYSDRKSRENIGSEVLGVIAHDSMNKFQEKAFQVNVSEKNIQQVTKQILDTISNNEGNDDVDWLDLVTKNNDLNKFFVD